MYSPTLVGGTEENHKTVVKITGFPSEILTWQFTFTEHEFSQPGYDVQFLKRNVYQVDMKCISRMSHWTNSSVILV